MFIGHYGVAFAIKSSEKRIPLWILFLAVQFVDVIWAVLVLLGVEKARITQEYRGSLPLDLFYMPYTHSLTAAVLWSLAAYAAYRVFVSKTGLSPHGTSVLVGLAVFSHWVADLLVHRPTASQTFSRNQSRGPAPRSEMARLGRFERPTSGSGDSCRMSISVVRLVLRRT